MKSKLKQTICFAFAMSLCIGIALARTTFECPKASEYVALFPHETDCNKFYECNNGVPYERDCPPGLHFNPTLSVCDWPELAGCE